MADDATPTVQTVKCWLCHRIREGSTWAALSVPIWAWGLTLPQPYNYYVTGVATLFTSLGVILSDGKTHNGDDHDN